jgi:hypothetical protein
MAEIFKNPFRPGAGQKPPYLAGREGEAQDFEKLLSQEVVFKNTILTGLRGTGKTVLLETFKPVALQKGWLWVGTDLSESASVSEETLAIRLLTDLAVVTSQVVVSRERAVGFSTPNNVGGEISLNYAELISYFSNQPGLIADKLKATLEWVWGFMKEIDQIQIKGIVFAYDEAQTMSDQEKIKQYPLSVLLDVFQSLQRKEIPFLLVLVGLPTLFSKLVSARTYSERMFEIIELKSLSPQESRDAITKPITEEQCPVKFSDSLIDIIIKQSGGYPYFIQFICREVYDSYLSQLAIGGQNIRVPIPEIIGKLDTVFFAGRWNNITDRQRELLSVIAKLPNHESEFTIQEVIAEAKKTLKTPISSSHMNQMFVKLMDAGLMHKTRHGKYSLGVPLLGEFINRQKRLD